MNTFGALKYLEAEQKVVEEIMFNLKDQLNKLKIEELAIRASIRRRMKDGQPDVLETNVTDELNQNWAEGSKASTRSEVQSQMLDLPSTSSSEPTAGSSGPTIQPPKRNMPMEVSINEALEMIKRYRQRDYLPNSGEDVLDDFGGESAEFEEAELDDAEIDEEAEFDESSTSLNPDMKFLDLRNAQPEDDQEL